VSSKLLLHHPHFKIQSARVRLCWTVLYYGMWWLSTQQLLNKRVTENVVGRAVLASTVILVAGSSGTRGHIFLSDDSPLASNSVGINYTIPLFVLFCF
jgi:hypothetical protein